MTNIMDGMDAVRFRSGNPITGKRKKHQNRNKKKMPLVLKNLKNGS
ncbi:hypothetical protein [Alkalihalobacillus sp. LMS39]|nr:hypothetical protein [Alkalihalobacillus sp. LMS39]UOE92126.1 hypothetical protein MM271_12710 [Alkalihalobacillus sp. LMS39]